MLADAQYRLGSIEGIASSATDIALAHMERPTRQPNESDRAPLSGIKPHAIAYSLEAETVLQ